ncbi:MAG: hypothetical protein ACXWK6_04340 [Myxococcaceae bacterium]
MLPMTRRALCFLFLAVGCKEAPVNRSSDARQSTLAGKWQGVSSVDRNGPGALARMELENAPGRQVRGVLNVSFDMDASDLGTIGQVAGPAQGGTFARGPPLPDGGFQTRYTMTVTASPSMNHIDIVEQQATLDGGPLPIYYRMERQ